MSRVRPNNEEKLCRVLIIEDNEGDVFLIREALRLAGLKCDLTTFSDGEQALHFVRATGSVDGLQQPSIVLLDLNLPKLDGADILAAMSESTLLARTPVIILTSSISPRDKERLNGYNIAQYLIKPSDLDEFMTIGQAVRKILES